MRTPLKSAETHAKSWGSLKEGHRKRIKICEGITQ